MLGKMASNILSITPRRSPRLAAKRRRTLISGNVRSSIRELVHKREGGEETIWNDRGLSAVASQIRQFINSTESLSSIIEREVLTDVGNNKVEQFLIITRKMMNYDDDFGPMMQLD